MTSETARKKLVSDLAFTLRDEVLPSLGTHAGREHSGDGAGGDVTFAIDEQAERKLELFLAQEAPDIAFYSEDRGLVQPAGQANYVLIVDPIDGTRPAMAGFESACVSVACAPIGDGNPTFGDVEIGAIVEIKNGHYFIAQRGKGLESDLPIAPSTSSRIDRLFWTYGLRGRPAIPTVQVLSQLIDASSVGGATFDLGSATYDMTRILTGQLDAYVEPGPRMVNEIPGMRAQFELVGNGAVLNNSPYDLAAAALCVQEGGGIVTDACGNSLGPRPLLGSGIEFQISCITSANLDLHQQLLQYVERGIARLSTCEQG